jgi:hypothetical protein
VTEYGPIYYTFVAFALTGVAAFVSIILTLPEDDE